MRKITNSRGNWWTPLFYELQLYKPFHCNLAKEIKLLCLSDLRHFRYTFLNRFERKHKNPTSTLSKESSDTKIHTSSSSLNLTKMFGLSIRSILTKCSIQYFQVARYILHEQSGKKNRHCSSTQFTDRLNGPKTGGAEQSKTRMMNEILLVSDRHLR